MIIKKLQLCGMSNHKAARTTFFSIPSFEIAVLYSNISSVMYFSTCFGLCVWNSISAAVNDNVIKNQVCEVVRFRIPSVYTGSQCKSLPGISHITTATSVHDDIFYQYAVNLIRSPLTKNNRVLRYV